MGAKKETKDKPDLSLIPYCVEAELAKAMEYGAKKYQRYNYTKGHNISQLVAAAKRHLGKYLNGEECDDESGVHHLGHAMANCLMMLHQRELGTLKDDRYTPPAKEETRLPDGTTMEWGEVKREFKVGDKVHSDTFNTAGRVVSVVGMLWEGYPIEVSFPGCNGFVSFTTDGRQDKNEQVTLRHL